MRHHIVFLALLILVSGSAVGQKPLPRLERGKIEELNGLSKIFVSSPGRDKSLVKKVTLTIQKELPGLNFVASPGDAEIWLSVYAGTKTETTRIPPDLNIPPNPYGAGQTRLSSEQVPGVRGLVTIQRSGTRRLIMDVWKTGGGKNRMAEKFAKEFIRTYQKAMGNP